MPSTEAPGYAARPSISFPEPRELKLVDPGRKLTRLPASRTGVYDVSLLCIQTVIPWGQVEVFRGAQGAATNTWRGQPGRMNPRKQGRKRAPSTRRRTMNLPW
jgi:hypothetical protein